LLLGISAPQDELAALLDQRGIAAHQASEAVMRGRENRGGLVACTPGGDKDAEERAQIIARRAFAAMSRSAVSGTEASAQAYSATITGRSTAAFPARWNYIKVTVETVAGGKETCVAYVPMTAAKN
jgi:hypothetical protein